MVGWRLTLYIVMSLGLIGSLPSQAMSLKQAVEKAVNENPRVRAAQASRRATDFVLKQAKRRYFPEISLSAEIGREIIDRPVSFGPDNKTWQTRRKATATIRQILFDGFDRANDVYRSQARISAASEKILARSEAVALGAIEAYIDVVRHARLITLGQQNVQRHRKLLELVQARVSGGRNSEGDLDQTRERLQAALALVSQIRSARDVAAAKFKNEVGVGPRRLRRAKFPQVPYRSTDTALRKAIDNNPRLIALRHEIDAAGFNTEQSRSTLYPTITLEGSATRGEDLDGTAGRSDDLRGVVMMRWKLFDGGVRRNRVEELVEREYVKVAEYDANVRQLRQGIEISWSRLHEGRRQVQAKREQLRQTQRVVNSYRREYEADKRSLLDVLDAENTRFAIEFDLSNISAIRQFAAFQLLGHTGTLLSSMGIAKPEGSSFDQEFVPRTFNSSIRPRSFEIPPLSLD